MGVVHRGPRDLLQTYIIQTYIISEQRPGKASWGGQRVGEGLWGIVGGCRVAFWLARRVTGCLETLGFNLDDHRALGTSIWGNLML